MAARRGGLGRGIDALIPSSTDKKTVKKAVKEPVKAEKKKPEEEHKEILIKLNEIEPNRNQPRKNFDQDSLQELAESIKHHGMIQPIIVKKQADYYEIVAGERRWRAARIAGLKEVPVIIKDYSDVETVEIAVIENLQREDLNPIEEAMAFETLIKEYGLKQDEVAERVSKSRAAITNSLRLLKLDKRVRQMVIDEMISSGHARALLAIENGEQQYNAAIHVFDNKLSVRETEKLVKDLLTPKKKVVKPKVDHSQMELIYHQLEERMKSVVGTKVAIKSNNYKKGKIEIEYYSNDELERIIDLIESVRQVG